MNCQDARESLSTLLDGDIGLTERVPLELHVDGCRECATRLADLQVQRAMRPTTPPLSVHWRSLPPTGLAGRALEALRSADVVGWLRRLDVAARLRNLGVTDRLRHLDLANRVRRLEVGTRLRRLDVANRWRRLDVGSRLRRLDVAIRWRRLEVGARLRRLDVANRWRRLEVGARLRRLDMANRWRPLGAGTRLRHFGWVKRSSHPDAGIRLRRLDVISRLRRSEIGTRLRDFDVAGRLRHLDMASRLRDLDVVGRLRHLVVDRVPPRSLALAAAVPLMVMAAIFVFERGFSVGVEMRQRAPSAPVSMRSGTLESTPAYELAPATPPVESPPAPPRPVSSPSPLASVPTPAEKPRVTRASEPKAVDTKPATGGAKPDGGAKQDKAAPVATSKAAPVKTAPAAAEPARKEALAKNVTVARAATGPAAPAPQIRRGSVDVVGRLQVKNRVDAERELAALVARAGGTAMNRQRGPAVTVVEAAVPHASYGKFAQGVVRLGSWRVEAERSPLPDLVQVTVRLAE